MHLINLNDISKSYGARTLYHSVSFGIESGEKVGFIGPNGVGKSTLVKIIAGEILPDQGSVTKSQGVKISLLEQDPQFRESDSIFDAIGEKLIEPIDQMAEIYQWISMLEFGSFGEDFLVSKLSGGWRKRVALARELITGPDLLILDEPTNHLDVSSILWLEEFLSRQSFACLVITHDRLFLQRVCKRIIDLDNRNPNFILDTKGDYLSYSEAKQILLSENSRHQDVLKNKLHREREWLSRGPQARQTKQKARIEAAGELEEQFSEVKTRNQNQRAQIDFGESERLPKKLIEAKGLKKSYGSTELFSDFNLLVRPQTRLGLLGDNGSGKSTLIRCLLGKIPVDAGEINFAENLQVSYFEQGKETLEDHKTVLQNICPEGDHVHFQGEFIHVRSYLERFLFYSHHIDQLVSKLSGGERARLRLAQLMLKKAQVLILDEPTNDLDLETLEVLETSLEQFHGAIILVSHDRYFMDSLCSEILSLPEMERFSGYFQSEGWKRSQSELKQVGKERPSSQVQPTKKASEKRTVGKTEQKKVSFKDKYEFENMETTIAELERNLAEAEEKSDYTRMAEIQQKLDEKFKRWAELEELISNK